MASLLCGGDSDQDAAVNERQTRRCRSPTTSCSLARCGKEPACLPSPQRLKRTASNFSEHVHMDESQVGRRCADHDMAGFNCTKDLESWMSVQSPKGSPAAKTRETRSNCRSLGATSPRCRKPTMATCHLCGKQFGTASIDIHIRQCQKGMEARAMREAKSPARPPRPAQAVLLPKTVACPICHRNFGPTSIGIHVPQCRKKMEDANAQILKPTARRSQGSPRPAKMTPLTPLKGKMEPSCAEVSSCCPVERMDSVWQKHLVESHGQMECKSNTQLEKQHGNMAGSPSRELTRRRSKSQTPSSPACKHGRSGSLGRNSELKRSSSRSSMADLARMALSTLDQNTLGSPRGEHCQEHLQESLALGTPRAEHYQEDLPASQKSQSRKSERSFESQLDVIQTSMGVPMDEESFVPCPHCRRTFLPDRLEVHLRSCRAQSPARVAVKNVARRASPENKISKIHRRSLPNLHRNAWQEHDLL